MVKFRLAALLAVVCLCASDARAESEALSIDEIRARLKENAEALTQPGAPAAAAETGFVIVDDDLDQAERALEASEAELVNQLGDLSKVSAGSNVPFASASPAVEKKAATGELEEYRKQVSALKSANAQLSKKLAAAESRSRKLNDELSEARNRLLLAETEVDRLSRILEERNRASIRSITGGQPAVAPRAAVAAEAPAAAARARTASKEPPVATVAVAKANLRAGPGLEHSPLMQVTRGTRLLVETRDGPWYRVITPNGTRAWVSTDIVVFGSAAQEGSTIKVRGYDASIEEEANKVARGRAG